MCETILDKHVRYMRFVDRINREGIAQHLLPFDLTRKMANIRYLGLCDRHFYILFENDNHEYFIWCLHLNTIFTSAYIPIFSLVKERNKITIKAVDDDFHEMYFVFYNMILSGVEIFYKDDGSMRFYCVCNGETTCKLLFDKCANRDIVLKIQPGCIILERQYRNSKDPDRPSEITEKIYELLLKVFADNLNLIDRHSEFKLYFADRILKIFKFLMKESNFYFDINNVKKDIRRILLYNECEQIKYVSEVLFGESFPNDESLPSLIMRAMIYENSLLCYRKIEH